MPYSWDFTGLNNGDPIANQTGWTAVDGYARLNIVNGGQVASESGIGSPGTLHASICPDQGEADHYTEVNYITNQKDNFYPVVVRYVDIDNWVAVEWVGTGSIGLRLVKCVAGTLTDIDQTDGARTPPFALRLEAEGENYTAYIDDVQVLSGTVSNAEIATSTTRQAIASSVRLGATALIDSFEAGGLAAATDFTLTNATATASGQTTANISVDTDTASGSVYYYVSANASEDAATIKANGFSDTPESTGTQSYVLDDLTPGTAYYVHFYQEATGPLVSNVISSAQFTTHAAAISIDAAPSQINVNDTVDVQVSGSAVAPTSGNTTIRLDGVSGPTATINGVSGSGPYTINFTFPRTTARKLSSGGYSLHIDINGETVDSGLIPFLPEIGWRLIDVQSPSASSEIVKEYAGGSFSSGDQFVIGLFSPGGCDVSIFDDLNVSVNTPLPTAAQSASCYRISAAGVVDVLDTFSVEVDAGFDIALVRNINRSERLSGKYPLGDEPSTPAKALFQGKYLNLVGGYQIPNHSINGTSLLWSSLSLDKQPGTNKWLTGHRESYVLELIEPVSLGTGDSSTWPEMTVGRQQEVFSTVEKVSAQGVFYLSDTEALVSGRKYYRSGFNENWLAKVNLNDGTETLYAVRSPSDQEDANFHIMQAFGAGFVRVHDTALSTAIADGNDYLLGRGGYDVLGSPAGPALASWSTTDLTIEDAKVVLDYPYGIQEIRRDKYYTYPDLGGVPNLAQLLIWKDPDEVNGFFQGGMIGGTAIINHPTIKGVISTHNFVRGTLDYRAQGDSGTGKYFAVADPSLFYSSESSGDRGGHRSETQFATAPDAYLGRTLYVHDPDELEEVAAGSRQPWGCNSQFYEFPKDAEIPWIEFADENRKPTEIYGIHWDNDNQYLWVAISTPSSLVSAGQRMLLCAYELIHDDQRSEYPTQIPTGYEYLGD